MALQHLRSNTASKRPTPASMADGQLAVNTNATSPGLFFKDAGGALIKVGPVHVGTSAPNSSPAGSSGNAVGEQWLDTSGGGYVLKIWDGSAWRSEAGEFVDAAGDTMTGDLVMNNADIVFEGSTEDDFETTLTVVDPTADRTITLPNVTGTVVTTGDSGTVTSTMILDGTIVNGDINASAAIADTKLDTISTAGKVSNSATTATDANTASAIVARDASGDFTAGTITADLTGNADTATTATKLSSSRTFALTGDVTGTVDSDLTGGASITAAIASGVIVNADVNASADIAFSKLANVSATDKLLGRSTASAGPIEEIDCTAAGRALLDDADAAAQRTTLGLEIGVDVQAYDADTAKLDTAQTFTAEQTFDAGISLDGPFEQASEAVAALDVDCSAGNYFTKAISSNSTFTFSNIPTSGTAYSFTLEVDVTGTSTTITWPASVKWPDDTAPSLTDAKTHLFMFVTNDGGTTWRGAALVDYTT